MVNARSVCFGTVCLLVTCLSTAAFMAAPGGVSAETAIISSPIDFCKAISAVAKRNIPAVVHIEVVQRQSISNPFFPFEEEPFFRFFFDLPRMPREFNREYKGIGSGILMDADGHVLTNNHVVSGATEIKVLIASGESYPAKLIGTEPQTDLAVLKVEAPKPFTYVTFGDSDKMEVGDWVVAIGHPRGLDHTVTQGIISAKHRRGILSPSSYQDFLQTDAAINPGNSGGPLLNLQGEVIGVNAAIVSQSGGFEGIGFAIPSNMALHVARQLISHGKVSRGWIGLSLQDITPLLAQSFDLPQSKGALVADVAEKSPAGVAGLRRGDVVLSYSGKAVTDSADLRNLIAGSTIGSTVQLKIWRNGEEIPISVPVGNLQEAHDMKLVSLRAKLGVDLRPLRPEESRKYGRKIRQGLVIEWIDPAGPMGQAGFEVNDVILEVNGKGVRSLEALWEELSATHPRHRRITFLAMDHRSGRTGYVQLPLN
ncbi:Do family serine endopeptidase [Desulfatiglans anilini]|uniref:Do family serine endopeptidase n=1 Tax=Desulfatiglans anilini TaxID=90728 RepID=UPI00137899D9|nr:Do family serine endopeptidase [Desulfatiglans anilini]